MQNLMELKNVALLAFYAPRRDYQDPPKWFGMRLATGHKMKIETRFEEPLTSMDYSDRILGILPLTLGCHASKFALLIDFEN
jgi:hypothetical protein